MLNSSGLIADKVVGKDSLISVLEFFIKSFDN
jgi:hypothetical protein